MRDGSLQFHLLGPEYPQSTPQCKLHLLNFWPPSETDSDPLGLAPLVKGNSAAFVAVESHTGSTVEKWAANMEKDSEGYRPVPHYP
jgi:hypothetical protein